MYTDEDQMECELGDDENDDDDEDVDIYDDTSSNDNGSPMRRKKKKGRYDKDEDEYFQAIRQENLSYRYFSGKMSANEDIEPASELVRRSKIIAKRNSISVDNRISVMDLHELDESEKEATSLLKYNKSLLAPQTDL